MGFAVLHIQKPKGNDARTTAHIERTVQPGNADPTRKHLNKELIEFPESVDNRTQAIQYRIENAGIKRKIKDNQIRALQVMLSGSPEEMLRIQVENKINEWSRDNIEWLQETFGKDNVVSAVLHLDEKTPHIHATVVPIVTGERRKAESEKNNGKKKYKKKSKDTVRLCADDVMTRDNLERFQDTYAEKMQKYGLQRGIRGSEAKHTDTIQHYKELFVQKEELKEETKLLANEKQEVYESVRYLYDMKDEAREKFLNMDEYVKKREKDIANIEKYIDKLKLEYKPLKTQEELNFIHKYYPMMKEQLRIAGLCEQIGLAFNPIRYLLEGKTLKGEQFKFYSPEHKEHFEAKDISLKMEKEPDNPEKLRLSLNGQDILDWFRQKFQELKRNVEQKFRPRVAQNKENNKGIKM